MSSLWVFNRIYTTYTYTVCTGEYGVIRQIKHLPQSPFKGQFFKITTFAVVFYKSNLSTVRWHEATLF
jgi:hypothetical protein